MEAEVLNTVLSEVLEELKEIKQQQVQALNFCVEMKHKVEGLELRLIEQNGPLSSIQMKSVIDTMNEGFGKVKSLIEAQPKSVIRQYRILLFPEFNAGEYYRMVFGRILFWMTAILITTYLFVLAKAGIEEHFNVKQIEVESLHYKKAWNYFYRTSTKSIRSKMDSAWVKSS